MSERTAVGARGGVCFGALVVVGLALNVAMDLEPFRRINPCGYAGLEVTQLAELGGVRDLRTVATAFAPALCDGLQLPRAILQ